MIVGVLSYQGAVSEHLDALRSAGVDAVPVKTAEALAGVDGLVLPGGESTVHGKLLAYSGLLESIRKRGQEGLPIFGTCTGLILLAKEIVGSDQPRLGLMDICVERNAFGRQVDSFEADIPVEGLDHPFPAVFIRAPIVRNVGQNVSVLARWQGEPVMVRQGNILGAAFHPELTSDIGVHRLFCDIVGMAERQNTGR